MLGGPAHAIGILWPAATIGPGGSHAYPLGCWDVYHLRFELLDYTLSPAYAQSTEGRNLMAHVPPRPLRPYSDAELQTVIDAAAAIIDARGPRRQSATSNPLDGVTIYWASPQIRRIDSSLTTAPFVLTIDGPEHLLNVLRPLYAKADYRMAPHTSSPPLTLYLTDAWYR